MIYGVTNALVSTKHHTAIASHFWEAIAMCRSLHQDLGAVTVLPHPNADPK